MTKVKICGITNLNDARHSVEAGADALGFNFYQKSSRYISPPAARRITEQLGDKVLKIGVFVNETMGNIVTIADLAGLDAVQLHGDERPEFVNDLRKLIGADII